MKTIQYLYKYVLTLILMMMGAQQLQAQDAFYIYRNDGNFDGFFYDEIVRMNYSKIDLEGEEHDVYVIQEIETNDSLYRIPLATIDSIGFQQPEIRVNKQLKIISRCGLLPYIQQGGYLGADFYDVPDNLMPQVGDVLIGLPTDENANELYDDGSFSCVVEKVVRDEADSRQIYVVGHPVEQISDVFDQYITVEEIGVDDAGNVRRRIAGCDPDGMPRREQGSSGVSLLDISGTFTREWKPSDNSSVALSADVGVKLKLRATYDISWTRFYVKLSHDLIIKTKPSLSMAVSDDFEYRLGDFAPIKSIVFPATCPIFQTDPIPELFVRGGGKLEAKLNLPAVELGFGDDFIIDSRRTFPIDFDMHMVPSENAVSDDMLDFSSGVSISGFLQTGVKLAANIATANWFKKVLMGDIGLFLYCGPKLEGEISYSKDLINGSEEEFLPSILSSSFLHSSLLSIDLEAKATAAAFWNDPVEKTFFSSNKSYMNDTIVFFPKLGDTTVDVNGETITVGVYVKPAKVLGPSIDISIGIYDRLGVLIKKLDVGSGSGILTADHYTATLSASDLKGDNLYTAAPLIKWGTHGPYRCGEGVDFRLPYFLDWVGEDIHFAAGNPNDPNEILEESVYFTTNCPKEKILIHYYFYQWYNPVERSYDLEVIDEKAGDYRLRLRTHPSRDLFERQGELDIILADQDSLYTVKLIQEASNISKLKSISASSSFWKADRNYKIWTDFNGNSFTATRDGDGVIKVSGKSEQIIENEYSSETITSELSFTINSVGYDKTSVSNGVIKQRNVFRNADGTYYSTETYNATFEDSKDVNGNELSDDVYFAIRLKSVTYHKKVDDSDNDENDEDITITMESVEDARVDINLLWDKDL